MKEFEKVKYIEDLADKFEVPYEQMMIAYSVIEVSQNLGLWDDFYTKDDGVINHLLSNVFTVEK